MALLDLRTVPARGTAVSPTRPGWWATRRRLRLARAVPTRTARASTLAARRLPADPGTRQ